MIKLYLKTISASLLILFFILLGFYLSFTYSIRVSAQKVHDILGIGNFSVLEHLLLKSNESQWNRSNEELKKLFPQNINAAQVIAMNSLPLTEKEKEQLLAGVLFTKMNRILCF